MPEAQVDRSWAPGADWFAVKESLVLCCASLLHIDGSSPPQTLFFSQPAYSNPPQNCADASSAFGKVLWGFFARTVWTWHVTWAVNSVSHVWGSLAGLILQGLPMSADGRDYVGRVAEQMVLKRSALLQLRVGFETMRTSQ